MNKLGAEREICQYYFCSFFWLLFFALGVYSISRCGVGSVNISNINGKYADGNITLHAKEITWKVLIMSMF